MRTVKEVSEMTGISVRTLHYYDEIGLFKPTVVSEAGYRLYDDKALEVLQQILFFREFDMPLKEIKNIMENPDLDKNQLLCSQKQVLVLKKERLERIIQSIDDILRGENRMDFEIFSKADIEQLYNEWYGDKDSALAAGTNPENPQIMEAYSKRSDAVLRKLAEKKGTDVQSFEVREIVGELDFVFKQLYQMKDVTEMMRDMADMYKNDEDFQKKNDMIYGEGSTQYIGEAIEAFYKRYIFNHSVSYISCKRCSATFFLRKHA